MTLRKIILIVSAMLVLIPSLLLSVAIYQKVYQLAENGVDQNIDSVSKQIVENIAHEMEILATRITLFSQHDILISAISDLHYSRLASESLTQFSTQTSLIESLYLVDNDGFVIESYAGNIPVLEDSKIMESFLSIHDEESPPPSLWFEYFENKQLVEKEDEINGLALIVPIKKTHTLSEAIIEGTLIAIIPIHKIMEIAEEFKTPTEKVSFTLDGQLIHGQAPILSDNFINKHIQFHLLNPGYNSPFLFDINVAKPTEEITETINDLLSPILTTGSMILIILLIVSMLMTNILARSFNQLNKLIKAFKLGGNESPKSFLITEFNDVSQLFYALQKKIYQQLAALKDKNTELAYVNKQREAHLVEVTELNLKLEEKVESRTSELKKTLDTVEHNYFILEELTTFRRALESCNSNRSVAKAFTKSINNCQDNLSFALYLPEQYNHQSLFRPNNIAYITENHINDMVLTLGIEPTSIHGIMLNNHPHHMSTFKIGNDLLGWVILKCSEQDNSRDNWIKLFTAELQSYLMMRTLNENLDKLASTDSLTRLKNRKSFDQLLNQLETQQDIPCVVYAIDVNGLKLVNDQQGHEQGDALITRVSDLLMQCTHGITDNVFRVGGDEFAIILNGKESSLEKALTNNLLNHQSIHSEDENVSFSFGCASSDEFAINMLYNIADKRMYQDKKIFYQHAKDRRR